MVYTGILQEKVFATSFSTKNSLSKRRSAIGPLVSTNTICAGDFDFLKKKEGPSPSLSDQHLFSQRSTNLKKSQFMQNIKCITNYQ